MTEGNILTPQQIGMVEEADPTEVLLAIHKRIVAAESLIKEYRVFAQNQQIEMEMLKERFSELKDEFRLYITEANKQDELAELTGLTKRQVANNKRIVERWKKRE